MGVFTVPPGSLVPCPPVAEALEQGSPRLLPGAARLPLCSRMRPARLSASRSPGMLARWPEPCLLQVSPSPAAGNGGVCAQGFPSHVHQGHELRDML